MRKEKLRIRNQKENSMKAVGMRIISREMKKIASTFYFLGCTFSFDFV